MRIPRRQTLVTDTYQILSEAIQAGMWETNLPGERVLCSRFLISRPTLRKALDRLEEEGVISKNHGRHRSINQKRAGKTKRREGNHVGLLCLTPPHEMIGCTSRKVAAIGSYLHKSQMTFQLYVRPKCYSQSPQKALDHLVGENPVDCWILQQTNHAMQQWFQNRGIPAVVSGTRYEGINLPFVDLDNRAICRHAVGMLLARNRKRICFVRINTDLPGDRLSESGFLEGIRQNPGAYGYVVRHNNSTKNICQTIEEIASSDKAIDSFVVNEPVATFCVASHLMRIGYRIPEDFAIIARSEAMYFNAMSPRIAYYTRPNDEMARRTAEFAIKLSQGDNIATPERLIIPDFVPGESLGKPVR